MLCVSASELFTFIHQALSHYPVLNASIAENGTEMIYHSNHNIGLAMDTPKGLLVPVIKQVQLKSILDIAIELGHLQVRDIFFCYSLSDNTLQAFMGRWPVQLRVDCYEIAFCDYF